MNPPGGNVGFRTLMPPRRQSEQGLPGRGRAGARSPAAAPAVAATAAALAAAALVAPTVAAAAAATLAVAGGAGPSQPPPQQQELSQVRLDDDGDDGEGVPLDVLLRGARHAAMACLESETQLDEDERDATWTSADERMHEINRLLDTYDLHVANRYIVHHKGTIEMVHVKARVLCQVFWSATDTTLIETENGKKTRSPRAPWLECMKLTNQKDVNRARTAAAEIIGTSVAWRICDRVCPTLMADFSLGEFTLEGFARAARKVIGIHLTYTQANGLTPKEARIFMKNDGNFDWDALVAEAVSNSAARRERNRDRSQRLHALVRRVHKNPALMARLARGMELTEDEVVAQLPTTDAEYAPPLTPLLAAMLTPEEIADGVWNRDCRPRP